MTESDDYHRLDVELHDTLILACNTSHGAVWTLNATKVGSGYRKFNYVYVNGSIVAYMNFLVTYSLVSSTNLKIYNIRPIDSGLYDCYESSGERITGYYVDATGMLLFGTHTHRYIPNRYRASGSHRMA